ncbi:MAG: hypothetical protein Q8J64_04995 [Thermodesulfovibrionales bacterium]|nr:hypothetical protein [Thermodesulfovibrionales bacterium]
MRPPASKGAEAAGDTSLSGGGTASFCEANRAVWQEFLGGRCEGKGHSVLVDGLNTYPGGLMEIGVTSAALKKLTGLKTVWVTRPYAGKGALDVMRSYCADRIEMLSVRRFPLAFVMSLVKSVFIFLSTRAENLLALKYKGAVIGDLIYDTYLRDTGNGTVSRKDPYLYRKIVEAVFFYDIHEKLIKKHSVKHIIVGHAAVYNVYGTMIRAAREAGLTVYFAGCDGKTPGNFTIRKFKPEDEPVYYRKVIKEMFDDVYKNNPDTARRVIEEYFEARMSGNVTRDPNVTIAFKTGKRFYTREGLAGLMKIDINKPFVYMMAHVFPDAPHDQRWYLFNDHYDWSRETIKRMGGIKDVNWILKEHPLNRHSFYHSKVRLDTIVREIYGDSLPGHIVFLPDDVSTKSVLDSADGVVTARGTIGLEAAYLGIKCLLAGDAVYSGLGFTFDPETKEEYFRLLSTLFRKDNTQTVDAGMAKVAAFVYFIHTLVQPGIIPEMEGFSMQRGSEAEDKAYADAASLLRERHVSEDYGINRILDYFKSGRVQMTNSFEIYK